MKKSILFLVLTFATVSFAQNNLTRFFLNPFIDAATPLQNTFDASIVNSSYTNNNSQLLRLSNDYSPTTKLTLGSEIYMPQISKADFEPSFISLGGRYNLINSKARLSIGTLVDLPISLAENLDNVLFLSIFSSIRYSVADRLELAGSFRFRSTESFTDDITYSNLGLIYSIRPRLNLVGEMNYVDKMKTFFFGGGVEYYFIQNYSLRGSVFFNDSNTAPNYTMFFGISRLWGN